MVSKEIATIVMAGGRGTRLSSVTEGKIPKDFVTINPEGTIRGIDHTKLSLSMVGLHDITYAANYYFDQYQAENQGNGYKMHYQTEGDCHGLDLKKIIDQRGSDKNYLVITTDMYYDPRDLKAMIAAHQPGTATWGVSNRQFAEMDCYRGLVVKDNVVVGDTLSSYPIEHTDDELKVRGGLFLTDGATYQRAFSSFQRLTGKQTDIDLYRDVAFLMAESSRRRVLKGQPPTLKAHVFNHPYIDYGTPDKLDLVRKVFAYE